MNTIDGGRIKTVRQIGASTYFDVFEASDALLNRPVFLKVARVSDDPTAVAVVAAHVYLWRALAVAQVPGMPVIFDIGQDGKRWFLTTEWIKSPSLRILCGEISTTITDPTKFLILLVRRCLTILQTFHEQGFCHADISPSNILADPHPRLPFVYLIDPAPPLNLPDPNDSKRRLILGTVNFLAPEVLAGDPASVRADLFSLGMVVAEAARILHATPPDLVQRLSASEPEHRPSSAEEALSILEAPRATSPISPAVFTDLAIDAAQAPVDGLFGQIGKAFRRRRVRHAPDRGGETTRVVSVPQREQDAWFAASIVRSVPVVRQSAKASVAQADFSVVAPSLIQAGRHFVVELWVAPSKEGAAMLQQATRRGRMVERGSRSNINLDTDTIITVFLRLPDFEIGDPVETLGWNGDIRNVGFIVKAPVSLPPGVYPGSAKLIQGEVPFASIMFDLEVVSADGQVDAPARPLGAHIQRIAHAFASYASLDRGEVLRRVQGIQAVGINVFLDIVSLRSGDKWEQVLYREIDASDSFFLFWSRNAAQSQWVEREWRYALRRRGLEFINPLPLEDPRLVEPPTELRSKHFNDVILAFIKSEQLSNRAS